MSANNWRVCPKCKRNAEILAEKKTAKAQEKYGKVPQEEFLALISDANKTPELDQTLRENYELGTDPDGLFGVAYSCSCSICKFSFNFKKEIDILP